MSSGHPPLAIVTGAASGIGKATVLLLLERGSRVIALDRNGQNLAALRAECGGDRLISCVFDLARVREISSLLAGLLQQHGPITQVVNNAGTWAGAPITEMSDDTWQINFDVNVTAPFMFIRALAPAMATAGGGAIVTVSSRNAFRSSVNNAAYDASKAAVLALTRTAAGELAGHRIRVNAVCPGVIDTPGDPGIHDKVFEAAYTRLIPMNRYGRPEEIASVIGFLLSDDASFITGESILVDGGQIACQDNKRFMEIPGLKA